MRSLIFQAKQKKRASFSTVTPARLDQPKPAAG